MAKEKEFNFEKAYDTLMKDAKKNGYQDDMVFNTLIKEFKRVKILCDRLSEEIEANKIMFKDEGSKGQTVHKTNPAIKDYLASEKALVTTSQALKDYLDNITTDDSDDWLQ